jgi:NAD(P)-dependent dehydrogenase (short-subunit alcohol dehydrogenase family)
MNTGAGFEMAMASGKLTPREAWNKSWDVNVTGTHTLTTAIVPLLFKSTSPRIIFITSGTASLTETEDLSNKLSASPAAGWPKPKVFGGVVLSYRCSKTGMNMMFRE